MKKIRKKVTAMALAAVLIQVWCNAQFHLEDWQVPSARLPDAFDGFRITLLTDIHGAKFGEDSARLLEAVTLSKPDLIAISGDIADRWSDLEILPPMLKGLSDIAPAVYVTGNHEWSCKDTEGMLKTIESCGVTVLRGDWYALSKDGQSIIIAGAEDPNGYADQTTPAQLMEDIRAQIPEDPYVVLLYHRNDEPEAVLPSAPDLVLSGHGHGGVVRLPVLGGLIGTDRTLLPRDCEGLYVTGRTTQAVSRGLAGVRVWNRPHLPTIVLRSVKNS
ncbi:MAG: metallophosphoesterase [Oscillospiraceae bacterium]|nr:metallophosphoesterase [Oscillospiraceae bacterium]